MHNFLTRLRFSILLILGIFFLSFLGPGTSHLCSTLYPQFLAFRHSNLDYAQLRSLTFQKYSAVFETGQVIPAGAKVNFSHLGEGDLPMDWIALRYHLYPFKVSDDWDYFIDFARRQDPAISEGNTSLLAGGIMIYAKPGMVFLPYKKPVPKPWGGMTTALVFILLSFLKIFTGNGVLKILGVKFDIQGKFWRWGTAYLCGMVVLISAAWLILLAGAQLRPGTILASWLILAGIIYLYSKQEKCSGLIPESGCRDGIGHAAKGKGGSLEPALIALSLVVLAVLAHTIFDVVRDWDGMSHWIMKAKVLYETGGLDFSYTHHNFYPILWPLDIALQFCLAGGMYDELAQWNAAALFLVFVAQLWGGLTVIGVARQQKGWLISGFLLSLSAVYKNVFLTANAENLFLALSTAGLTFLLVWLKDCDRRAELRLALLLFLGLSLCKLEGSVTAVILGVVLAGLSWNDRAAGKMRGAAALFLAVPVLPLLWIVWQKQHGYAGVLAQWQDPITVGKIGFLLNAFWGYVLNSHLGVVCMFLGVLFVVSHHQCLWTRTERFLAWAGMGIMVFAVFAGIGGCPTDGIQAALTDWVPRLMTHASPFIFFLLVLRLSRLWQKDVQ